MPAKKTTHPFYEKLSLVLIGLIALGYLVIEAKEILDPMIFGFLFAILLLPISNFFEKKLRFHRSASSFMAILLLLGFIVGLVYLVGSQISNLSDDWPQLKEQVMHTKYDLMHWVRSTFHFKISKQVAYVNDATSKIVDHGASVVGTTFGALSSLLLFAVFILIFTFFILFYRRLLLRFLIWVFNEDNSGVVHDIVENVQSIIRKYIIGLLLEMLIVATVACSIFLFLGIKYALLLGIITGLFNIIPYVGIFSALLLSTTITFATGTPSHALEVAISVVAIHIIDSNLLLPMVVGSKVKLNALISFLGIIIGEMVWGLSGMFLSIPVIAILKIIFDRIESLKPWGFLLGGDYEYKKSAEEDMATE